MTGSRTVRPQTPVGRGTRRASTRLGSAVLSTILLAGAGLAQPPPVELPDDFFDRLEYRHIGPLGNRVSAVIGEPGNPKVYYVGAASGGIFKTGDGGAHFSPIFDEQPAASIGALALAPSDPNVLWAGTGETFIRSNVSIGNGVYRSRDGGRTWSHAGLEKTGRVARLVIHPRDPDRVYVAALGHCYGPQPERGIFRSTDGGGSWERVLFVDERTGASDLVMDPGNPRILLAGTWQMEIRTWGRTSGGPGSGLYRSRDGGESWERLEGNGLPPSPWGKVGLTMSAADSDRIYALIETSSNRDFAPVDDHHGVLWRSEDGGESWRLINHDHAIMQRPLYYGRALAAPDDADEITFLTTQQSRSLDGGRTFTVDNSGWDHHDMWIDPLDPDRRIVGHDGGISISTNRGRTWLKPQLPIAQVYHVDTDRQIPYFVYGNRQDGPSVRGPSNSLTGGEIPLGAWHSVGGCETGFAVPDPLDRNRVWSGCYDGILELHDLGTGHSRDVSVWPLAVESWPASELRYRFQWTFPIALSPHDPKRVYVGSQHVHVTSDGGQSWSVLSPDLTTGDPELMRRSGGLTFDDAGPTLAPTVFAIAESPLEPGVIWAGTNDGQLQITRNGGDRWTNVTAALPDLPPLGTVSNLEPSRHAAGTLYLTIDRHQLGDPEPYVYKSTDYGRRFRKISGDLPRSVFGYAHCVREDPVRSELLYAGTENALYVSFDDGGSWHALQSNLPHAPVHWLTIQEDFSDLVVATYGRGFWILDDVTPLREVGPELLAEPAALLPPRPAYRFRNRASSMSEPESPATGRNPDYGATLHYYLKEAADPERQEKEEPQIRIRDREGEVVRTLDELSTEAGLHRVVWDLRYDRSTEVKLRTRPQEHAHVQMPEKGWRSLPDGGRFALLAPPGTYRVGLEVGERVLTQELEVRRDPGSAGDEADIAEQMQALLPLAAAINRAARLINGAEELREQLESLEERLEGRDLPGHEAISHELVALATDLAELESAFFDLRMTGASQDTLRWRRLLYARFTYLARRISQTDFPPTDQQREVSALLLAELDEREDRWRELSGERLAALNARLAAAGASGILVP